jgi:uncharacterized protein (TIRG00374 family)
MAKKKKQSWLAVLYWVLFILLVWLIYRNIEDYSALVTTFQNANWVLLGYAFLIAVGSLYIYSLVFESNFKVLSDVKEFPRSFQEYLISYFLSLTTPLGATGGQAYMVTYLKRQGFSTLRSLFSIIAANLSYMTVFFALLAVTLRYLSIQHNLTDYQVGATLFILFYAGLFAMILLTFLVLPNFSIRFARVIAKIVNWFPSRVVKQNMVEEEKIDKYTKEIMEMSENFDKSILKFVGTIKFSAALHFFNIVTLFLIFQAYGTAVPISSLLIVYCVLVLFSITAPTPQGIGFAEGLAHLAAISIGITGSQSLMAILTFRLFTIWLPVLLGFILFRAKVKSST